MTDIVTVIFDLKDRVVDTTRAVKMLDVNKKMNNSEILNFHYLLADVGKELETFDALFVSVQHISDPQTELGKLYKRQCLDGVNSLKATLQGIEATNKGPFTQVFPTVLKESLAQFDKQLGDLKEKLEKLASVVVHLHQIAREAVDSSANQPDNFKVINMVPANPEHIVLDFEEDSGTPESKLKKAIFDVDSIGAVSAVASGMGGVGKTCALRGVGQHQDAPARFPGGIFYMSLGAECGKDELIQNLAVFVRRAGGYRKSKEVEVARKLQDCVNLAAEWFRGRICLFLIDDVWCKQGIDSAVTEVLAGLSTERESRIAFTTRDVTLRSSVKIRFNKRDQSGSEKMLLCSAGLNTSPEELKEISAMETVLNMSHGLPIALNVIGSRARYMLKECGADPNHVWSIVLDEYENTEKILFGHAFHNDRDEMVMNVLLSSLDMIDSEKNEGNSRHLFTMLSIIRKRQEVPFAVVERIWGLSSEETKNQVEVLRRFNIVELSVSHVYGQSKRCILLHDLFVDLARHLAKEDPDCMKNTAKRVLLSYVADKIESNIEEQSASQTGNSSSTNKKTKNLMFPMLPKAKRIFKKRNKQNPTNPSDENKKESDKILFDPRKFHESWIAMEDDGYVLRNLFRLLHIGSMNAEGISLLQDPRWIAKQMDVCGWKQLDTEFAELLAHFEEVERSAGPVHCKEDMHHNFDDDVETFLRMVRVALSESERHIMNSRQLGMLPTQLYGRLYHYRGYKHMGEFLKRIEATANGLWMKSQCAFPAPVASAGKVLDIGDVRLVRYGNSCVEIVHFDEAESLFRLHHYFKEDDVFKKDLKDWKLPSSVIGGYVCNHIGLSQDSTTFVTGVGRDTLVFEERSNDGGNCFVKTLTIPTHDERITSLALSNNGCNIVTGTRYGNVVLWKKTNGKWISSEIGTHGDGVTVVSIDNSGMHVASGSWDKTAILWKFDGSMWVSSVLQHEYMVSDCKRDNCGTIVLTGTWGGKVRLWKEKPNGWEEEALEDEWFGLEMIKLSEDKNLIVCATFYGVVVLERERDEWKKRLFQGHAWDVTSVEIIERSRQIVSASRKDGTVRIWDMRSPHWKTSGIDGEIHTNTVRGVAVTNNRVVSVDSLGKVIVWDLFQGKWTTRTFAADGRSVAGIHSSQNARRLRVNHLREEKSHYEYYIERDGAWGVDTSNDRRTVTWTESPVLVKDKWPLEMAGKGGEWSGVYEVPGGEWFAVKLHESPFFDIVRLLNRP